MCTDGLAPPIEEWQKAINDQLEKIRKLEETYDNELILKKVWQRCIALRIFAMLQACINDCLVLNV